MILPMERTCSVTAAGVPADAALPSEGVRTLVSFLLFVHLFALMVAVASNAGPVSAMRRALREAKPLIAYLQLLHMDLAYNFHLTHATEWDTDHFLEIERDWKGQPDANAARLKLPEPGGLPGIRAQRYHNLARNLAGLVGQDEAESILPYAISRGLLAQHGITGGRHRFRCRRHFLLEMREAALIDPADRDPFHSRRYGNVYEADLKFVGGQLLINKVAGAAETAPAARSP